MLDFTVKKSSIFASYQYAQYRMMGAYPGFYSSMSLDKENFHIIYSLWDFAHVA